MDSTRLHDAILKQEQPRKASSSSAEEQVQSQDDSLVEDVHLSNESVQENATKKLVSELLQESRGENSSCSSSNPSPKPEAKQKSDVDLTQVVSSLLLDEGVHREESCSFLDAVNSRKPSAIKSELTRKTSTEKKANKMHSGVSKAELARRERERLHLIRTKVNAAIIIQRWFRKWTWIKRERCERDMMLCDVKNEQVELSKEVAALTIQLAWRKHVRVEFEKSGTKNQKIKKAAPNSASCKPKENGVHFYGRSMQHGTRINNVNSRKAKKQRSPYMKYQPSAAAMSYNMAMDLYHPMGSRQGNTRAAMVTAGTRVRPGSMKRTVNGWSHDVGFLSKMNGECLMQRGCQLNLLPYLMRGGRRGLTCKISKSEGREIKVS